MEVNDSGNAWSRFTNKHSENLYIFIFHTIKASSDEYRQVIPKYIVLKSATQLPSVAKAVEKAKHLWLRAELKKLYSSRDHLSSHLKLKYMSV